MSKESPYKKLKTKLQAAEADLMELAINPDSDKSIIIKLEQKCKFNNEKMFWMGNREVTK